MDGIFCCVLLDDQVCRERFVLRSGVRLWRAEWRAAVVVVAAAAGDEEARWMSAIDVGETSSGVIHRPSWWLRD